MLNLEDAIVFGARIAGAAERVADDYATGDVVHEEPFSDQLCGRLKETLHGFETPNVRWQADVALAGKGRARLRARTLTKTKEEPLYGADLVMVLDLDLENYKTQKGFLAQAKRLEPGKKMDSAEWRRLNDQCEKMLSITPASVVFPYHTAGVTPISATAVLAYQERDLFEIETWSTEVLFADFALCWIGDPHIQATDPTSLDALRMLVDARAAIRVSGSDREPAPEKGTPPREVQRPRGPRRRIELR